MVEPPLMQMQRCQSMIAHAFWQVGWVVSEVWWPVWTVPEARKGARWQRVLLR
jgi:hypothetical protein